MMMMMNMSYDFVYELWLMVELGDDTYIDLAAPLADWNCILSCVFVVYLHCIV